MNDRMNKALEWCFKKSIWVYHVNAGGCNGCDIEILDALTPYYDVERFGIKLVHTPRHADALLVAGPVTRQVRERVLRIYDAHARSQTGHRGGLLRHGGRYLA
jgi:Ni,Fe-hydrogenase III small subunit